ncbi:unnamed protein product [Phytophthora lilii]|uniref:Unnamed protein product n=1 Tax=Phytophthora lilii TaxID=2077276 RepID=A0A9W7CQP5_9STRA|nr:unnamed protein product [Phytophthora lilii]
MKRARCSITNIDQCRYPFPIASLKTRNALSMRSLKNFFRTCSTILRPSVIRSIATTSIRYEPLIRKIIDAHGLTGMDIPGVPLGKTYKLNDINQWIGEGKYSSFFEFCKTVTGSYKTDYGKLMQLLSQVPVLGFNSGRYDINLIKNDLFAVLGTDNIRSVIKNPSYMCIATHDMKMLDISNYVPAGTSYAEYLSTYLEQYLLKASFIRLLT